MTGIWIIGAGELATGVAWRLLRSGYGVVMSEIEKPLSVRRLTCFSDAVYRGRWEVEGVPAIHCPPAEAGYRPGEAVVTVDPTMSQAARLKPAAIIDARMLKTAPGPSPLPDTPLIGLGPGFVAGRSATLVIETHRLARPGEVIRDGAAMPNTGVPGPVGGETARRLLRAPADGRLSPNRRIGDLVEPGDIIGYVGEARLRTEIAGLLRGLIHESVELYTGMKVGDVDPRGETIDPHRMSDKSLSVGGGVLEALLSLSILPYRKELDP